MRASAPRRVTLTDDVCNHEGIYAAAAAAAESGARRHADPTPACLPVGINRHRRAYVATESSACRRNCVVSRMKKPINGVVVSRVCDAAAGRLNCRQRTNRPRAFLVNSYKVKGKVFPYSLPSVGPGADPGVQAVSPQVT